MSKYRRHQMVYTIPANRFSSGVCREHLDKLIFLTEDAVREWARQSRPGQRIVPYPCPVAREHYHARDQTKRNNKSRKKRRQV